MLKGADMKRILGSEAGQAFINAKKFLVKERIFLELVLLKVL